MPANKKDGDEKRPSGKVVVVHTDMDPELQNFVKTSCLNAMKNFEKGELQYFMDVAKTLKEALDKHTPDTCWHVIVGKQFGSYVTNERKKYVLALLPAYTLASQTSPSPGALLCHSGSFFCR